MSGKEIIEWAVRQCEKAGYPPLDCNILMFIREWHSDVAIPSAGKDSPNE